MVRQEMYYNQQGGSKDSYLLRSRVKLVALDAKVVVPDSGGNGDNVKDLVGVHELEVDIDAPLGCRD